VLLSRLERIESLEAFGRWLAQPGPGSAASTSVRPAARTGRDAGLALQWRECIEHYAA